ncbi:diguanylate cyclase [Jannaschia seohaensis]|uniref:diguanylate cyclase n=1 Tax=Jannaschia seohaensis TaxID=475081 RepID=A0A2Y9AGG5_9RHOB|nr:diguanylate cyclase [Jannaschia seohaensis]PWJ21239.1 two-component system cell cycle response regulator [Jannaschia seohaensis]SSA41649.1 two-component system, cell cycle response regulator [Jannaschia seohaensis]
MTGRILIVDDVATSRIVLKVKLNAARYSVECVESGEAALEAARRGGIDLIVMDMMMPGMGGAEACARLRADPATAAIPVILVTAAMDDAARMEGLASGADDFLQKPVDDVALLARVRSLLRSHEEERMVAAQSGALLCMGPEALAPAGFGEPAGQASYATQSPAGRVALIAGGDTAWLLRLREQLRPHFRENLSILKRDAALAITREAAPDLFLVEADLAAPNAGLRLMSELRSRQATRHSAVIVLLPAADSERAATALDLGASDVAYRPCSAEEIAMRIRTQLSRKSRADRLRDTLETGLRLASIDPLTGLHNRRWGLHHLSQVSTRCRSQGVRAGVVLMDIDHFKAVNDTHGHIVGDRVLASVAQVMRDRLRLEDIACRIGGEEFLAILPGSTLEQTRAVAERLRGAIEAMDLRLEDGTPLLVTMSLGVAMLEDRDDAADHVLTIADRALYAAKGAGRNQVALAETA